jgi:outer membrane lipoprotein
MNMRLNWIIRLLTLIALSLTGCASTIPRPIRDSQAVPVEVNQVQRTPQQFKGQQVRWGGTIVAVHNGPNETEIEVLSRPLDSEGEPLTNGEGRGRFIVEITGFIDPAVYAKERELTVVGPIIRTETRQVGDFPYIYPIIRGDHYYLWPQQSPPTAYPYYPPAFGPWGFWYGPYFGPWMRPWYF